MSTNLYEDRDHEDQPTVLAIMAGGLISITGNEVPTPYGEKVVGSISYISIPLMDKTNWVEAVLQPGE